METIDTQPQINPRIGEEVVRTLITVSYAGTETEPQTVTIFMPNDEFTNRPA